MNPFKPKATKVEVLEALVKTRNAIEAAPATKEIIRMHDIITRFEAAFNDGRDPSDVEVEGYLLEMIHFVEKL